MGIMWTCLILLLKVYSGHRLVSPANTAQVCKHSTEINSEEHIWDETAELIKQTGLKQTSPTTSRRERETDPNTVLTATGPMSAREHFVSLSKRFHNPKNLVYSQGKFEFQSQILSVVSDSLKLPFIHMIARIAVIF